MYNSRCCKILIDKFQEFVRDFEEQPVTTIQLSKQERLELDTFCDMYKYDVSMVF